MPLYRQIQNQLNKSDVKTSLVSIFPDDSFVAQHDLDAHGLHGMHFIADVNLAQLNVSGTPTLLLIDSRGTILRSWVGELSKQQQDEVMTSIQ